MTEPAADALARLYDLDLAVDPGDLDLYRALAARTGGPIVELCAGSGRIAVPLAAEGYAVTAVDLDPAMLRRAARLASASGARAVANLTTVEADLFDGGVPGAGGFRLAVLALNSILLLGGPRRQREAVTVMAGLVAPGGVVVIDAWQPVPEDLVRFDGRTGLEWLRTDPESGRSVAKTASAWYDGATRAVTLVTLFDEWEPGGPVMRHAREDALHLVAAEELEMFAEAAGLEVEVVAGDYDLTPMGPGADRTIVVARRPDSP